MLLIQIKLLIDCHQHNQSFLSVFQYLVKCTDIRKKRLNMLKSYFKLIREFDKEY